MFLYTQLSLKKILGECNFVNLNIHICENQNIYRMNFMLLYKIHIQIWEHWWNIQSILIIISTLIFTSTNCKLQSHQTWNIHYFSCSQFSRHCWEILKAREQEQKLHIILSMQKHQHSCFILHNVFPPHRYINYYPRNLPIILDITS
jgi:hypothetical protein